MEKGEREGGRKRERKRERESVLITSIAIAIRPA
jgi:hypothetical protein